jgi:hypothetical protein
MQREKKPGQIPMILSCHDSVRVPGEAAQEPTRSVVGVFVEVKRWRQPGVIPDHFRIVRRIQSLLRCVEALAGIVADRAPARERKSVAGDDDFGVRGVSPEVRPPSAWSWSRLVRMSCFYGTLFAPLSAQWLAKVKRIRSQKLPPTAAGV